MLDDLMYVVETLSMRALKRNKLNVVRMKGLLIIGREIRIQSAIEGDET